MIQLRWLVSPRSDADRVLQYRYRVHADVSTLGFTEWMNVPEEIGNLYLQPDAAHGEGEKK